MKGRKYYTRKSITAAVKETKNVFFKHLDFFFRPKGADLLCTNSVRITNTSKCKINVNECDTIDERRAERQRTEGGGDAMSSSENRIPNGEAPAGGSPRAPVGRPGNRERSRAFLGDTQGDVVCGVCRVTLQLGHRAVRYPCGQGRHVFNARCVVEALARGVTPTPLRCPAVSCRAQHPRRDALEAAVPADPGHRNRAARTGGGTAGDAELRSRGL